jgi:hypothetical protein
MMKRSVEPRPKRYEVTGRWRNPRVEELHNLYFSPNIGVIKSRRMRCVRLSACMRRIKFNQKA